MRVQIPSRKMMRVLNILIVVSLLMGAVAPVAGAAESQTL